MSTVQEGQHARIIFKGIDGNECEEFVAALEDLAYAEGWAEDRRRMLFFARSRLRNAALRWFARLDPSVQNDWGLFVQALFDQYPPVTNPLNSNEVGVATPIWSATTFSPTLSNATLSANPRLLSAEEDVQTGASSSHPPDEMILGSSHIAAVPSLRSYDSSRLGVHVGRLRIVYEAEIPPAYVWRGKIDRSIFYKANDGFNKYYNWGNTFKCVTRDRQDALIVSFRADPEPHPIACLDASQDNGDLAILLDSGSAEFHLLGAMNGVKTASVVSWDGYSPVPSHQWVSKIWNVLGDGTLQANLSDFTEPALDNQNYRRGQVSPSNWTTKTVYMDTTGMPISFSKDFATPNSLHPDSNRPLLKARIVFEPL